MTDTRPLGRLLITGVPGWLTGALIRSLRTSPPTGLIAIRCLVQPGTSLPHFEPVDASPPLEFVTADLRDAVSLRVALHGVDTVMHAAGILHVRHTRDWYDINTGGTQTLLDGAIAEKVQRFVFISSNAAAGRSSARDRLLTESDPANPLSHYGRSKLLAEDLVNSIGGRMETVILRPCMFYGPPVPERHSEVYRRIIHGGMPLVGGGSFARSLTYIDNLVQGCRLALEHRAAVGQTYYISDDEVYTTRRVVESMAQALGVQPRFVQMPEAMGPLALAMDLALARLGIYWQTLHLVGESNWHVGVSCAKATRELGYRPLVRIDEGMRRAVGWCRATGLLPNQTAGIAPAPSVEVAEPPG